MFNIEELETVCRSGGNMHRLQDHQHDGTPQQLQQPQQPQPNSHRRRSSRSSSRLLIDDHRPPAPPLGSTHSYYYRSKRQPAPSLPAAVDANGRLTGVYEHYLLVRPHPSLRVVFASPALRIPGMLQSPFLARIGGSPHVRDELAGALAAGRGVTARVRWLASPSSRTEGRPRWVHCTPLLGSGGAVGVWMVVLIDDDEAAEVERDGRRWSSLHPAIDDGGAADLRPWRTRSPSLSDLPGSFDWQPARDARSRTPLGWEDGDEGRGGKTRTRPTSMYTLRIGDE